MEPPSIKEIDRLADRYQHARNERMRLTAEETDAADLLEACMKKHGLTVYEYEKFVVFVEKSEKVRVRTKQPIEFVRDAAAKLEATNGDL